MERKILAAGVVVVRREGAGFRYLLLRAYQNWDFPKGTVEEGEEPFQTAKREVEEESGPRDLSFPWGTSYRETAPYGRGKVARYYIAATQEKKIELPVSKELGRPEHHEGRWFTYEEARRIVPPRLIPILDWAHGEIQNPESRMQETE